MPDRREMGTESKLSNTPDQYADAARVASLAEAGYLVSVLQAEGLDAVVRQAENFNASNGAWQASYVVQSPKDQLPAVAAVLRSEAASMNDEADFEDEAAEDTLQRVVWRPVALMAVAGVVCFIAGQHLAEPTPRGAPRALSDAVGRINGPFYTAPGGNGVRHRLSYDKRSAQWFLDADVNGDGRFDQRSRFPGVATAAVGAP